MKKYCPCEHTAADVPAEWRRIWALYKLKYQSFKKKVYAMKLEAPADKMIMLLQTGAFTFWGHQVMDFVHKIDIQGVLQSFVLVLMRGKCSESKCAVSAWSRPSLLSKMDFTKGFTLDYSTKESHFTVYNGNCGQFMISLVSIYVSFWVNKPIKNDWSGL